jgi:hypothetical protein
MLTRRDELPVRQYVIYIGRKKLNRKGELKLKGLRFSYNLLDLSTIDYRLLLHSEEPGEKILAVLGDFGKEDPAIVISRITTEVMQSSQGELERQQRETQLRILLQLRKFTPENIKAMESISTFFKKENDFLYCIGKTEGKQEGEKAGIEKSKTEFVMSLLLADKFITAEIADYAGVTEDFVNKVKNTLN